MSAVLGDTSVTSAGTPDSPTERHHPQENYAKLKLSKGAPHQPLLFIYPSF